MVNLLAETASWSETIPVTLMFIAFCVALIFIVRS